MHFRKSQSHTNTDSNRYSNYGGFVAAVSAQSTKSLNVGMGVVQIFIVSR